MWFKKRNNNQKLLLKGFTTMELSIVMLLTGLISSMAYGGYSLMQKQISAHAQNTNEAFELQQFMTLIKKDTHLCNRIHATGNTVEMHWPDNSIAYNFEYSEFVTRTQSSVIDTFRFHYMDFSTHHINGNIVDKIQLSITYKKQESSLVFTKKYDSYSLIQQELNNGH